MIIHDPPLTLAVITFAAGLEDAGRSDPDQGFVKVLAGIDRHVGRGAPAQCLNEFLFLQPVLRHFQRARVWVKRHLAKRAQRRHRHILELIGHHRAIRGESRHRGGIVPMGAGKLSADFGSNRIGFRGIDVDPVTQLCGGFGQHPAQLPAAQNADGFARRDHGAQLGLSATPAL